MTDLKIINLFLSQLSSFFRSVVVVRQRNCLIYCFQITFACSELIQKEPGNLGRVVSNFIQASIGLYLFTRFDSSITCFVRKPEHFEFQSYGGTSKFVQK